MIKAGRRLAVLRLESGKSISTTWPRSKLVIEVHFRAVPIFRECGEARGEIMRLLFGDATPGQVDSSIIRQECDNNFGGSRIGRAFEQFHLAVFEDSSD